MAGLICINPLIEEGASTTDLTTQGYTASQYALHQKKLEPLRIILTLTPTAAQFYDRNRLIFCFNYMFYPLPPQQITDIGDILCPPQHVMISTTLLTLLSPYLLYFCVDKLYVTFTLTLTENEAQDKSETSESSIPPERQKRQKQNPQPTVEAMVLDEELITPITGTLPPPVQITELSEQHSTAEIVTHIRGYLSQTNTLSFEAFLETLKEITANIQTQHDGPITISLSKALIDKLSEQLSSQHKKQLNKIIIYERQ